MTQEATLSIRHPLHPPLSGLILKRAAAALLAVSLAANAGLSYLGYQYFRDINAVRLDPSGLAFYANDPVAAKRPGQLRVALFGDSRALMWSPPNGIEGVEYINRGIGNQTTRQILGRFEQDMSGLAPDVVVLELGVNDIKTVALFPERRAKIVADTERNIHEVVERCLRLGAKVVLVTVFPIGPIDLNWKLLNTGDVGAAVSEVNRYLEGLASDKVTLLRASEVLLDSRGKMTPAFAKDMLHLTPVGYAALNERKLVPLLRSLR